MPAMIQHLDQWATAVLPEINEILWFDGTRNLEPWSGDEDDTCASIPSLLPHNTSRRTFELSTDLTCIAPLHGGYLVLLGLNS
ncbi:hypothetical protein TNCV_4659861 [Trichonephila clavipes]|uniref:Uncharacterized protein n=1 Tax=Trichonephila clavipes TaxID=2585209 RepID=A0A8X6SKU3_TRICX|nr:hypothetical protein TNCV_4659861 [Trichonephila clavipes]